MPRVGLYLALACGLGVATRLYPLFAWAVWGSDTGEYFYLTERLLAEGSVVFAYDGWGLAYPYFPGLYALSGIVTATTGLPLLGTLLATVPAIAGITLPLGMFVITRKVVDDERAALFAAFAIAFLAPNVVTTNHAMPGALGQVLVVATLAVLVHAYEDARFAIALPLLAAAVVWTHHLSTFLLTGAVLLAAFTREFTSSESDARKLAVEVPLVIGLTVFASIWWLAVAEPMREQIIGQVLDGVSPWVIAVGSWTALAVPVLLVALRRRFMPVARAGRKRRFPSPTRVFVLTLGTFVALIAAVLTVMATGVPGTPDMKVGGTTFAYLLPPFALFAFTGAGLLVLRFARHRHLVIGWVTAIGGSIAFGIVTRSQTLIPYRHVDYLTAPLVILAAAGFVLALDYAVKLAPHGRVARVRGAAIGVAVLIIVSGSALSQVPREAIAGFEEGISESAWGAIVWSRENLAGELVPYGDADTTVIAADHPASSLLWGYAKLPASFDYARVTYHADRAEDAFDEMWRVQAPPPPDSRARIDYVFVSPEMRGGVALLQWENAKPMSEAAMRKFYDSPYFETVYPVAGCDTWDPCFRADDTQIFRVLWPRILQDWTPPSS